MQSPIFVTEYGCGTDADEKLLIPTIESQDKAMISASIWPWKNNCFQQGCETSWSLYDSGALNGTNATQNGPERPNRIRILSRVHPRGVVGQLKNYFHNTTTSSFTMTANCVNQTLLMFSNETLVYIPRRLNNSIVNVTGEATLKTIIHNPDQSRLAVINPTCNGQYQVWVANSTDALNELQQQTMKEKNVNDKSITHHDKMQSMIDAYELFQRLHAAAVKIGHSFARESSHAGKVTLKEFLPLFNQFYQ